VKGRRCLVEWKAAAGYRGGAAKTQLSTQFYSWYMVAFYIYSTLFKNDFLTVCTHAKK
jgi:hypothetical protein